MRLRTIILAIVGVIVLAIVAAVVVLLNMDFGKYKGLIADQVEQATGRKLTIAGNLKLVLFPTPALSVSNVAFANMPGGSRPDMAKLGSLDAEVKVLPLLFGGNVSIAKLVMKDVDVLLETDAKGRPNWALQTKAPPAAAAPVPAPGGGTFALPEIAGVDLSNIVVTYRDGVTGKSTSLTLKELETAAGPAGALKVTAAADYNTIPITVNATLGALALLTRPGTPYPVTAEVSAAGADVKLEGTAGNPVQARGLNFTLAVDGKDLAALSPLAGTTLPSTPYHLAAVISGDADGTLNFKSLQASLGPNSLSGDAAIALNGARPRISGNLAATTLDLTALPAAPPAPQPAKAGPSDKVFSSEPLPLEGLRAADADLTLNVATLKTASLALQNLSLHLTLNDRLLDVKPLTATVAGSPINIALELSARQAPAVLNLQVNGKQVDVGALLKQTSGQDLLVGKGDVDVAVHGSGDSPHAIMASLDGYSSLVVGKGTIKSRYADLIGADVFREAFAWAKGKQDTQLNCMVSRFNIKNGLATANGLLVDTSEVTIAGEGTANFGSERLDLVLTPRPKETSLLNLATPIDVTGSFKQPSIQPDKVAMAKNVAVGVASMVNPLVAIGNIVLDNSGDSDKNPCLAALESGKGAKAAPAKSGGGVSGAVGGAVKSIGHSIDSLFK